MTISFFYEKLLISDYKMSNSDVHLTRRHMTTLLEFARALRVSIQNINENSYNNFITQVGINIGPVVAGVIGARYEKRTEMIMNSNQTIPNNFIQLTGNHSMTYGGIASMYELTFI